MSFNPKFLEDATAVLFENCFLIATCQGRWRHLLLGSEFPSQIYTHQTSDLIHGQILSSKQVCQLGSCRFQGHIASTDGSRFDERPPCCIVAQHYGSSVALCCNYDANPSFSGICQSLHQIVLETGHISCSVKLQNQTLQVRF